MNKRAWILAAWCALGALAARADGTDTMPGIEWEMLDEAEQQLLDSQKDSWDELPPGRQQAMAEGAERWLSMSPEERKSAQQRWRKWRELTPYQRDSMRERWKRRSEERRVGKECRSR